MIQPEREIRVEKRRITARISLHFFMFFLLSNCVQSYFTTKRKKMQGEGWNITPKGVYIINAQEKMHACRVIQKQRDFRVPDLVLLFH